MLNHLQFTHKLKLLAIFIIAFLICASSVNAQTPKTQKLKSIHEKALKVRAELISLEESMSHAQSELKILKDKFSSNQQKIENQEELLENVSKLFENSRKELNKVTLEYTNLSQSVAGSIAGQKEEQVLLDYLSNSNVKDAALVYQSTNSLLENQNNYLDNIRDKAQKTYSYKSQLEEKVEESHEIKTENISAQQEMRELIIGIEQSSELSKSKLEAIKEYENLFKYLSGDNKSLFNNPLFNNDLTDPKRAGKLTWPVRGSVVSPFTTNRCLAGLCRPHEGIDIAVETGNPIYASANGRASFVGVQSGYGNFICIQHSSSLQTCYAHLSEFMIKQNQKVRQGQMIGTSGCTGRCFGPHLHFETRVNNGAVDPLAYLP